MDVAFHVNWAYVVALLGYVLLLVSWNDLPIDFTEFMGERAKVKDALPEIDVPDGRGGTPTSIWIGATPVVHPEPVLPENARDEAVNAFELEREVRAHRSHLTLVSNDTSYGSVVSTRTRS